MYCNLCQRRLHAPESFAYGRCIVCRTLSERAFTLALAERIYACHEILAHKAERRPVVLTERTYCPLTGDAA